MVHINTVESPHSGVPLYDSNGDLNGFGSLQVPIASVAIDQLIAAVNGKSVKEEVDSHCIIGPFQSMEDYMVSCSIHIQFPTTIFVRANTNYSACFFNGPHRAENQEMTLYLHIQILTCKMSSSMKRAMSRHSSIGKECYRAPSARFIISHVADARLESP